MRCSSWCAMLSATSCASSSGRLISSTLIDDLACSVSMRELVAQLVHLGAPLADHHARTAGVHGDHDLARLALDLDLGDAPRGPRRGCRYLRILLVLLEELREVLRSAYQRDRHGFDDAEPEADRMRLLSH